VFVESFDQISVAIFCVFDAIGLTGAVDPDGCCTFFYHQMPIFVFVSSGSVFREMSSRVRQLVSIAEIHFSANSACLLFVDYTNTLIFYVISVAVFINLIISSG